MWAVIGSQRRFCYRVSAARRVKNRMEVVRPWGCTEVKRPWKMKPLPIRCRKGGHKWEGKTKKKQTETEKEGKRENTGMRNTESKRASWIWGTQVPRAKGLFHLWGGADKNLAQPEREQAIATKLGIYSTYSPRSWIHFLAHCSNFCKPLKKIQKFVCRTRSSMAAMNSASDETWRPFNCVFSPGNRW